MLKIRLRRTGAKKQPRYRVVVAESSAPRDGAYVEVIGHYNPQTDPSTVRIDLDKARDWLSKGAQPSDRVVKLLRRAEQDATEASARLAVTAPTARAPRAEVERAAAAPVAGEVEPAEAEDTSAVTAADEGEAVAADVEAETDEAPAGAEESATAADEEAVSAADEEPERPA